MTSNCFHTLNFKHFFHSQLNRTLYHFWHYDTGICKNYLNWTWNFSEKIKHLVRQSKLEYIFDSSKTTVRRVSILHLSVMYDNLSTNVLMNN